MSDIFARANKETYDNAIDKANEIKSALVESFFAIQSNLDLLTQSHKETLADYLKLTKNGKRDKAQETYTNVFEPALEMLKAVKRSEEVNKSRNGYAGNDFDKSYKDKMTALSRQHFLGEKQNA